MAASLLVAGCSTESKIQRHLERGDEFLAEDKTQEAVIEFLNVIQLDPEHREANKKLGLALYDSGQFSPAFNYLQRAASFEPDNAEVRVRLATIHLLRGQRDEAREEAGAVLDNDNQNLDALVVYADTAASAGEIDGAVRRLENARDAHENRAKFHLALGALHLKKQEIESAEGYFQQAAQVEPDSPDAHLALGTFYLAKQDVETAKTHFARAADSAPIRSATQIRVVDYYRLLGENEEANRRLSEIVESAPDLIPAWTRIAGYAFEDEEYDRAEEALNQLLASNPKDPEALRMMGEVHLARGEQALSQEKFREAITVFQDYVRRRPELAYAHFRLAQLHARVNEFAQAMNSLERVIELAPNSPQAALMLAELQIRNGIAGEAIPTLERVLQLQATPIGWKLLGMAHSAERNLTRAHDAFSNYLQMAPDDPDANYRMGTSLVALERSGEARQYFLKSLELDPSFVDPLTAIAIVDVSRGSIDSGIARVRGQLEEIGDSAPHYLLLGQLYQAANRLDASEEAFRKSVELDPKLTAGYARLAGLYVDSGRRGAAIDELDRALRYNRDNVALMMLKGTLHQQENDLDAARAAYERLLEVNPRFAPAANNLAYIYMQDGRLEEALTWAEVAREENPDNPDIADTLGWILYKREVYPRALALLKEASAGRPNNPEITYHLGFAHHKMGEFKETLDVLGRALAEAPDFALANEARTVLDELR